MANSGIKKNTLTGAQFLSAKPIYGLQLTGQGGAKEITSKSKATPSSPFWIHLDYLNKTNVNWLKSTPLIPDIAKIALINRNQPVNKIRFTNNAMLVILKGVNITPGNKPDPIVTLSFYITDNYIISTRHQKINAISELKAELDKKIGPVDVSDWLVQISDILANDTNAAVEQLHLQIILVEDGILSQKETTPCIRTGMIKKQLILLRHNITHQRDIFMKISTERISCISSNDRLHMHDVATSFNNYINDIDSFLLRLASIIEQANALLTESINKRIYIMSVFATIFMPLTFLASLFGMNLKGIPFNDSSWSFYLFTGLFFFSGLLLAIWFKKRQWI